jgi:hypothetical protein
MPSTEVQTLTQTIQMNLETSHGVTPGAGANKTMPTLMWDVDPDFATNQYAPSGARADSASVPSMEKSKLKVSAAASYIEQAYLQAMLFGDPVITTPAGAVNARKHNWPVSIFGPIDGRTAYLQKGDSVRARSAGYVTLTDLNLSLDRKECKIDGAAFGQLITDGVTLTASPTAIAEKEVQPKHWNVYLDSTAATIGQTKLTRCFAAKFGYTGAYNDIWPLDRAQPSYAATVNQKPKMSMALTLMADSTAGALWTPARAAQKYYLRLEAIGDLIDNLQTLTITGTPTGGTFALTYKGQTASGIAYNAIASTVQTALQGLSTIGSGNVIVTGGPGPGTPYVVQFVGALAQDTTALTHADSFTGGASPALGIVASSFPFTQIWDMCVVPAPDAYSDKDGAFVQDWLFNLVFDPSWSLAGASGTFLVPYLINNLPSL